MKTARIPAVAVLIVGSGLALYAARAQQPGVKSTDLQRHDLGIPGAELATDVVEKGKPLVVPAK